MSCQRTLSTENTNGSDTSQLSHGGNPSPSPSYPEKKFSFCFLYHRLGIKIVMAKNIVKSITPIRPLCVAKYDLTDNVGQDRIRLHRTNCLSFYLHCPLTDCQGKGTVKVPFTGGKGKTFKIT